MKNILLSILALLLTISVGAQQFTNYYSGYRSNYSVVTDDSLVYVGCENAINVYYKNGSFKEIIHVDGSVFSSVKDKTGNLWFSVMGILSSQSGGVIKYDGENWDFMPVDNGFVERGVNAITCDTNNNIWVTITSNSGTSNAIIAKYNGTEWKNYSTFGDTLTIYYAEQLVCDTNNIIYAGTDYGVIAISATDTSIYNEVNSELSIGCIHASYVDKDNNVWFGGHFFKPNYFDGEVWHIDSLAPGDGYYSIFQDTAGFMWFGAGELYVQNDTGYVSYNSGDIIEFNGIGDIKSDDENNIWIATQDYEDDKQGCLVKFDEDGFHNYFPNTHIGTPREIAFSENDLLLGTNAPISYYDGENWSIDVLPESINGATTSSLCTDELGNFWIGTENGLYKKSPDADIEIISVICGDTISFVQCVASFGTTVWVKSTGSNLYKYDGSIWTEIDMSGAATSNFLKIIPRNQSEIWVASYAGAIKFDGTSWSHYSFEEGLQASTVKDYAFSNDSVWMATTRGIALLFDNVITTYLNDTAINVAYRIFYSIAVDKTGTIWAGCSKGVYKLDGTTIEFILPSNLEESIYTIREDPDHNLWFCGSNAISKYTFDNSGIENPIAEQNALTLYPNPASEKLSVYCSNLKENDVLEVISITGKVIASYKIFQESSTIDISIIKPGIYLVRLKGIGLYGKIVIE